MENIYHKFKLLAGIISGRIITGPQSVQISFVDSCNYRCLMCWEHSSEIDGWGADKIARDYHENKKNKSTVMDFEVYKSLISSLRNAGTKKISFAGIGEPLLHKKIVDAVSYAKSQKMDIWITTNGSLLEKDLMRNLADAGLDDLSVSINAGSSQEYGLIHKNQKPDRFDKIMDNIAWLDEYKKENSLPLPRISFSSVISKMNYHHVLEMMESSIRVGASRVSYRPLGAFSQTDRFTLNKDELEELYSSFPKLQEMAADNGIDTDIGDFKNLVALRDINNIPAPCFAGWLFPFVLANGDITYCCTSREVLGNLHDESFEKIWSGPEHRRLNKMALKIHKTQQPIPKSRCIGCELTLANLRIYNRLWPIWGRPLPNKIPAG